LKNSARIGAASKKERTQKEVNKLTARDEYIKQRVIKATGKDLSDMEVKHSCGRISFTLAVIIETNKQIYQNGYKNPHLLTEKFIQKIMDEVIDKLSIKFTA